MRPLNPIWKIWIATCLTWIVLLCLVTVWMPGVPSLAEGAVAALLYGIVPVAVGSALVHWSVHNSPFARNAGAGAGAQSSSIPSVS